MKKLIVVYLLVVGILTLIPFLSSADDIKGDAGKDFLATWSTVKVPDAIKGEIGICFGGVASFTTDHIAENLGIFLEENPKLEVSAMAFRAHDDHGSCVVVFALRK